MVTQFQFEKLLDNAYIQASTATNAISVFKKCEIVPYNLDIFGKADFSSSKVTDNAIIAVSDNLECNSVNAETSSTSGITLCDH